MDEIHIRPANINDCPALGSVLVSSTNNAFRGLVPDKCLTWTAEQSAANWKRKFKDEGRTHLLVRVATINPNVAFYERLGAVKLGTEPLDWDGFETELSVYGWPDISQLFLKEGLDG